MKLIFSLITLCALATANADTYRFLKTGGRDGGLISTDVTPGTTPFLFGGAVGGGMSAFGLGEGISLVGGMLTLDAPGGGVWGTIEGDITDQDDLQAALTAKLSAATAASTYQTIIVDGALTIARTSGLQGALDAKLSAATAASTYQTIIVDGSLTIARTSGLQGALDAKLSSSAAASTYQPLNGKLTTLAAGFGELFLGTGMLQWNGTSYQLLTGSLSPAVGGTGHSVYSVGDLLYASDGLTLARLSGNTATSTKLLTSTGGGLSANAPVWSTVAQALGNSGVTAGSYTNANFSVDATGRITSASNGSSGLVIGSTSITGGTDRALFFQDGTVLESTGADYYIDPYGQFIVNKNFWLAKDVEGVNIFLARNSAGIEFNFHSTLHPYSTGMALDHYDGAAQDFWIFGDTTHFLKLGHDGTNANISTNAGGVKIDAPVNVDRADNGVYFQGTKSGNVVAQVDSIGGFGQLTLRDQDGNYPLVISSLYGSAKISGGVYVYSNNSEVQLAANSNGASVWWSLNQDGVPYRMHMRKDTNANAFWLANTWTSSTDYESGGLDWQLNPNVLSLGTWQGSGGGAARDVSLVHGGTEKMRVSSGGVKVGPNGTPHSLIKSGVATLSGGAMFVSDSDVLETGTAATSSRILVTRMTDSGDIGDSYTITRSHNSGFTILSKTAGASASNDNSTVSWILINP